MSETKPMDDRRCSACGMMCLPGRCVPFPDGRLYHEACVVTRMHRLEAALLAMVEEADHEPARVAVSGPAHALLRRQQRLVMAAYALGFDHASPLFWHHATESVEVDLDTVERDWVDGASIHDAAPVEVGLGVSLNLSVYGIERYDEEEDEYKVEWFPTKNAATERSAAIAAETMDND